MRAADGGCFRVRHLSSHTAGRNHWPSGPDGHAAHHRTAVSRILGNRFYVGELHRNGQVFEGKYRRLIDRATFDACQDVLHGRNRRTGSPDLPLSGGLFQCAYCGQSITGERIRRKLKDGGVNEHIYYRCANNSPGEDHPRVRWKADDLERAVVEDLARMRLATPELAEWFRTELRAAVTDLTAYRRQQSKTLDKRKTELATMQDRLLNAYLAGTVEEGVYKTKSAELKADAARADETLAQLGDVDPARGETAMALFDWTQNAAEIWRGSNNRVRRDILDSVCLNRTLGDVNLYATKRKPFDVFAKRLEIKSSRGDCRIFEPLATLLDRFVRGYPVPAAAYLHHAAQLGRRCA